MSGHKRFRSPLIEENFYFLNTFPQKDGCVTSIQAFPALSITILDSPAFHVCITWSKPYQPLEFQQARPQLLIHRSEIFNNTNLILLGEQHIHCFLCIAQVQRQCVLMVLSLKDDGGERWRKN